MISRSPILVPQSMFAAFPSYFAPANSLEAVRLLEQFNERAVILAGGTLTMPEINLGSSGREAVISLDRLGLDQIIINDRTVRLGAMVRLVELASARPLSPLHKAVASIGGPAIRNMATVGGNICARHPYGDLATLLLALDAQLTLSTTRGTEVVDLAAFYAAEDRPRRARLIVSVQFQLPAFQEVVFQKLGRRCVNTPSIVTVAARITRNSAGVVDRACVALGGVGDNPMRSYAAEEALIGKALDDESIGSAAQKAAAGIAPLTDSYASAWYRSRVIPIQVRRALSELQAVAT